MGMKSKNPVNTSAGINTLSLAGAAYMRGKSNPNHRGNGELAGEMAVQAQSVNGLDITKVYVGLFLAMSFFIGLFVTSVSIHKWDNVPYFLEATLGNWLVGLILMLVAGVTSVGFVIGMIVTLPQLIGIKMKARVYEINGDLAKTAGCYIGNPILDLIAIAICAPLFFAIVYPFFLLQNAFEVLRVVFSWFSGSPKSLRGDSGRYYDRLRMAYAQMLANGASKAEAENMLREACEGMFTASNEKISTIKWNSGAREQILATMIRRHGPIEAYVGKVTALGSAISTKKDDLRGYGKDRDGISRKYSAL